MDSVLSPLVAKWLEVLTRAGKHKRRVFGRQAADCHRFYSKADHTFVFDPRYGQRSLGFAVSEATPPSFQMSVNKVAEAVSVYLPALYHRNPNRLCTPRRFALEPELLLSRIPPEQIQQAQFEHEAAQAQIAAQGGMPQPFDPRSLVNPNPNGANDTIRSRLQEFVSNYTPRALDLKTHSRRAITEALVTGRGVMWVETVTQGTTRLVGSFYDSVRNLFTDPDADTLEECQWVARRRLQPIHAVERRFGLAPGTVKPGRMSHARYAELASEDESERKQEATSDLVEYFEVYSRIGAGGRISGAPEELRYLFDNLGDALMLVVSAGHNFFFNLPPELEQAPEAQEEIASRLSWPIPFYEDQSAPWPCAVLDFRDVPNCSWPQSIFTPAIGLQKFIDWLYSCLMSRTDMSRKTRLIVPEGLEEEVKNALLYGDDFELIPIASKAPTVREKIVEFLQAPEVNKDTWQLLQMADMEWQKITGVNELRHGIASQQMRSAEEARVRSDFMSVRPDDMANRVEDFMSLLSAKEAQANRLELRSPDVAPIFGESAPTTSPGPLGAQVPVVGQYSQMWDELVATDDPVVAMAEFEYRIESGSVRKPNRQALAQQATEGMQLFMPTVMQVYMQTGVPDQANFWTKMWIQASEIADEPNAYFPDLRAMIQQQQQMAQQQSQEGESDAEGRQETLPLQQSG